jgi:hypothetical protein
MAVGVSCFLGDEKHSFLGMSLRRQGGTSSVAGRAGKGFGPLLAFGMGRFLSICKKAP